MRTIRFSALGYGLLEAWSFCIVYSRSNTVGGFDAYHFGNDLPETFRLVLTNSSDAAVMLGTLAFVLLCLRSDRIRNHRKVTVAATAFNVVGTALIFAGNALASLIGLTIAGLGNAWLWISWGDVYSRLDIESVELTSISSVILQVVVTLLIFVLPQSVQMIALLLAAPVSCLFYVKATRFYGNESKDAICERALQAPIVFNGRFAARAIIGLGIPIALVYYLWDAGFSFPMMNNGLELVVVIGLLLFALVFIAFVRFAAGFSISSICRIELALAVGTCLIALVDPGAPLGSSLVFAGVLVSQYLMLVYCARLHGQGLGNVVFVFGSGQLINHGFGLLGSTAASLRDPGSLFAFSPSTACVLCAIAFFAVTLVQGSDGETTSTSTNTLENEALQESALRQLAKEFHLSSRETEIFFLLAKGRSAPFIRDELMISLNTVSSHVKHIYAKTGIHSRQELIDLVDRRK